MHRDEEPFLLQFNSITSAQCPGTVSKGELTGRADICFLDRSGIAVLCRETVE